MHGVLLKIGLAIIVFGLFGLALSSGLPDLALVLGGFGVAAVAIVLGLRLRPDESRDDEG